MAPSRASSRSSSEWVGWDRLAGYGASRIAIGLYGATSTRDSIPALDDVDLATVRGVTNRGFPVGGVDVLSTWGNSTVRTSMTNLRTSMNARFGTSGKVHLYGFSAGALACLNWAKYNSTLVQSMVLVIPVVDVQDIYTNNRGGFAAAISAAYGGAPPDADNPADNAASFTGIPHRLYYSEDDPICIASTITTFASASGGEAISMGSVSHFWDYDIWNGDVTGSYFRDNNA